MTLEPPLSVLCLDVGDVRIGLALASFNSRIASPYSTIIRSQALFNDLTEVIEKENVTQLVVGYPRGLSGQVTIQTKKVEDFISELKKYINLPLDLQDEALTSYKAEEELNRLKKPYRKDQIDALAATYILTDWLIDHDKIV